MPVLNQGWIYPFSELLISYLQVDDLFIDCRATATQEESSEQAAVMQSEHCYLLMTQQIYFLMIQHVSI